MSRIGRERLRLIGVEGTRFRWRWTFLFVDRDPKRLLAWETSMSDPAKIKETFRALDADLRTDTDWLIGREVDGRYDSEGFIAELELAYDFD
jgi:hypothetical protein